MVKEIDQALHMLRIRSTICTSYLLANYMMEPSEQLFQLPLRPIISQKLHNNFVQSIISQPHTLSQLWKSIKLDILYIMLRLNKLYQD